MKKLLAAVSSALLMTASFVALSAAPAQALTVVDLTGSAIKFAGGNISGSNNTPQVYRGAATVNGLVIDAVVTPTVVNATMNNLDNDGQAVTTPPPNQPAGTLTAADLLQTKVTPSSAGGYVELNFKFYEGGTYTGAGTGIQVQLNNVQVNSYDLDYNSGNQFSEFKGFQSYNLSTNTTLAVSSQANGWTRFVDTQGSNGANYNDGTGSYTKGRVKVNYDYVTDLGVRVGVANGTGFAYFALDLSGGYTWTDSSGGSMAGASNNPTNTAPTTSNVAMNIATGNAYYFNSTDFPYTDAENNAFANLKVVSLPASGTLEYLNGSTWTAVTAGQVILVSDINLGKLRFTGSANTTFTFQVQDGLAFSTTSTFTANVVANSQTITFNNPGAKAPSQTFASGATSSSGLTVTLTSNTTAICTVSGLNITTVANGTCSITATQAGNATYGAAQPVTQTFSVSSLTPQTITFAQPSGINVSSTFASGATASSGLTVTLISLTPTVCTVSGLNITTTALGGTCQIRASQAGNGTYAPASDVTRTFIVATATAQAVQTIAFAQPANVAISTASVSPGATASSGLTVSYASSTTSVCTISGSSITILTTGDCTVTASQAGDANYSAAANVTRTFKVFGITTSTVVGGTVNSAYSQSFAATGGVGGGTWSTVSTLPSGLTLSSSGVLSGTPTAAFNGNITVSYTEGGVSHSRTYSLVISAAVVQAQTITFPQPANIAITTTSVNLGATASSGLAVSYTSNTPSVCIVNGNSVTILTEGTCSITANQAGNGTYGAASSVTRSFNVIGITTTSLTPGTENTAYSLTFTEAGGTGNGTWSTNSTLPAGLTLNANGTLSGTPTAAFNGSVTITYTEGGVSHSRTYTLVINSASAVAQTITFPQLSDVGIHVVTVAAAATATSGLFVTIASNTPSICTIALVNNAYVVTVLVPGMCSLTATQNGNSTYGAATPVTRTFMVLGITTGSIANGTVGQGYSQSLTADGGSSGNYTWSLVSGNLAQYGLTLSNLGVISGTPSQQSTALGFTITVQVDDSGVTTTRQYTIVINPAQVPTIPLVYKVSPNRSLTTGGGTSVITGNNLQGATQVVVGGIIAQITSNNNSQITFIIPARQVGTVDILLTVQAGSLRIASAMTYYELPKPTTNNGGSTGGTKPTDKDVIITISGFAPGSPVITNALKTAITNFIKANPGYKHMYCTGFTMGPTVLPVDFALSTNRATASCAVALSVNPTLTAKSQVGVQETNVGNQVRRVTIRLSNK